VFFGKKVMIYVMASERMEEAVRGEVNARRKKWGGGRTV